MVGDVMCLMCRLYRIADAIVANPPTRVMNEPTDMYCTCE